MNIIIFFSEFRSPDHNERNEKIHQIRLIFINVHHLINEYRPIQARDTLRIMLENQVKEIKVCFYLQIN